ncbi:MAG: hypothetical protein JSR76_02015 [Verrucomicrobia bacterium]|nr:hypothetical protein [Verrucomicrobiota bacterium]
MEMALIGRGDRVSLVDLSDPLHIRKIGSDALITQGVPGSITIFRTTNGATWAYVGTSDGYLVPISLDNQALTCAAKSLQLGDKDGGVPSFVIGKDPKRGYALSAKGLPENRSNCQIANLVLDDPANPRTEGGIDVAGPYHSMNFLTEGPFLYITYGRPPQAPFQGPEIGEVTGINIIKLDENGFLAPPQQDLQIMIGPKQCNAYLLARGSPFLAYLSGKNCVCPINLNIPFIDPFPPGGAGFTLPCISLPNNSTIGQIVAPSSGTPVYGIGYYNGDKSFPAFYVINTVGVQRIIALRKPGMSLLLSQDENTAYILHGDSSMTSFALDDPESPDMIGMAPLPWGGPTVSMALVPQSPSQTFGGSCS